MFINSSIGHFFKWMFNNLGLNLSQYMSSIKHQQFHGESCLQFPVFDLYRNLYNFLCSHHTIHYFTLYDTLSKLLSPLVSHTFYK